MKIKTFEDNRTFTEKTGWRPEDITDWPNMRISILSPEEETEKENRKKTPPAHHLFDIEFGSQDKGKEPELLFVETLFCYYWQFKNGKNYTNKELSRSFTVRKFCHHHEVEKSDLNKIILASYEIRHHLQTAWQSDRYRAEILQQIDLYLKERPAKVQSKGLPDLMEPNDLAKLNKLLLEKKYIKKTETGYQWTGIKHETARGKGLQLVALAKVCRPLLNDSETESKTLWQAWTTFYAHEMKYTVWTPGKVETMHDSYFRLFNFVNYSFRLS